MTDTGLASNLQEVPRGDELTVYPSRGLTNVLWSSGGLVYVVVADFPKIEAIKFARAVDKNIDKLPAKTTGLSNRRVDAEVINNHQRVLGSIR